MVKVKSVISNRNGSFTVRMEGYSITSNIAQLEDIFNKCFGASIIEHLRSLRQS